MKCKRSVIVVILLQLDYLCYCLDNCADDTLTETDRRPTCHGVLLEKSKVMEIRLASR